MKFKAQYLPYRKTGVFSAIVQDYVSGEAALKDFYQYEPSISGIKKAIRDRKKYPYNRGLLADEMARQYEGLPVNPKVAANIESLRNEKTFTICTAHQPNIFTGHLYFIYKIVHAIRLADKLNDKIKSVHFVPVYYMGSEDADLEELGEVTINGKKYIWQTDQTGAVGRMLVDKAFIELMNALEGQLAVEPHGKEMLELIRNAYTIGKTIERATLELVHHLFAEYGLLIFLPDNPAFKKEFHAITYKELTEKFSQKAVAKAIAAFPEQYKVQAAGREINLFYLKENLRERIEVVGERYFIANSSVRFTKEEINTELTNHPERFSPNVILRPLFQEQILPNVVFIGGGGELAYWLELKNVFSEVAIPFPVLILRNSFMVVNKNVAANTNRLQFKWNDLFKSEKELIEIFVKKASTLQLLLTEEKKSMQNLYGKIQSAAMAVDVTLSRHVDALSVQAQRKITQLEKKMLKAERKKFEAAQRQLSKIKSKLFPGGTLQERVDNLMPYYAAWGRMFIKTIYDHSLSLEQEFCVLVEK